MKRYLITFGDESFRDSMKRIKQEALKCEVFDEILCFSPKDVSEDLRNSCVYKIKRGFGLWSWKPDVILQTLLRMEDGDILVYADSGCSLYPSKEWVKYFSLLEHNDILAFRTHHKNIEWTRKSIIDFFGFDKSWYKLFQYAATVIFFKKNSSSLQFVERWRAIMMNFPSLVQDVPPEKIKDENPAFIENRHDQAVFSALVYENKLCSINCIWEHFEGYDLLRKQCVRATRLKNNEHDSSKTIIKGIKRFIKDYIFIPYYNFRYLRTK